MNIKDYAFSGNVSTERALDLALEALEALHKHGDIACVVTPEREFRLPQVITAIKQVRSVPVKEPVAWKNAAIRLGEELSSVGPAGYYDMTAEQWLDWAMTQQPRGKNSLPAAQRQWVGLTDEERNKIRFDYLDYDERARATEAKLKEKNNG